jgi:hypothetical protein
VRSFQSSQQLVRRALLLSLFELANPRPERVSRIALQDAFFPRVLIHLVALHNAVAQRIAVEPASGERLLAMPQRRALPAVAAQLAGHLGRRRDLREAAKDRQDRRLDALKEGPRPDVEDAAAGAALIVYDRRAVTAMNRQAWPLPAMGASPAVGVEQFDESSLAAVLIARVDPGEIHGMAGACHEAYLF